MATPEITEKISRYGRLNVRLLNVTLGIDNGLPLHKFIQLVKSKFPETDLDDIGIRSYPLHRSAMHVTKLDDIRKKSVISKYLIIRNSENPDKFVIVWPSMMGDYITLGSMIQALETVDPGRLHKLFLIGMATLIDELILKDSQIAIQAI